MTVFITLDAAQAAKLRGITKPGHALDPIVLADGVTYILPLEVLDDPAHADVLQAFALGKIDVLDAREPVKVEDDVKQPPDAFEKLDVADKSLQREVLESEFKVYDIDAAPVEEVPADVKL